MICDLYSSTGLAKIRARNNHNPMKTGEVRKFKIDKTIKDECGLPGQGEIEIEIKKEKARFSRYQYTVFLIPSEKLVFGSQPNSVFIFEALIAYLLSCPCLSLTKAICFLY